MDPTLKWVELPIGAKMEPNKHPLNLADSEVLLFRDVTATEAPGSVMLREISTLEAPIENGVSKTIRIGEQNRPDGTRTLASVGLFGAAGQNRLLVRNPANGDWISTFGAFPLVNLGSGESDLSISPDAVRACGKDGLANIIKLGTLPYEEGGQEVMPRQFHSTLGPQKLNFVGIGQVLWDGKVKMPVDLDDRWESNNDFIEITVSEDARFLVAISGSYFATGDHANYYYTLVYEGGQESPPVFTIRHDVSNVPADRGVFLDVSVKVARTPTFPAAIKAVNIYRKKWVDRTNIKPDDAVLVKSIPIYKDTDDFVNWDIASSGDAAISVFSDRNEDSVIGGTYFDRQQISYDVTELSPNRRHHRLFSDRMFAWGVVADDGRVYGNRLYYSHVNGLGISCYDIIPPANYVEFPFNIVGLVSVRSHRIVIGDSKYAIGYFSGGGVTSWRIYEGETEMGCRSAESIADTPFGAAYVGYDGIYIVSGMESSGPIAKGIVSATESTHDWHLAKAEFAQNEQEYVIVVPHNAETRGSDYIVALNLRTGGSREITGIVGTVQAIGKNSDGKILLATTEGVYVLEGEFREANDIDKPDPVIRTGFRNFTGGRYQAISRVAIHGSSLPGSIGVKVTPYKEGYPVDILLEVGEDGYASAELPASQQPALAHQFEFTAETKDDIDQFRIDRVWVQVNTGIDRELI